MENFNPWLWLFNLWEQIAKLFDVLIEFLTSEITIAGETFSPIDGLAVMTGIFILLYLIKKFIPGT